MFIVEPERVIIDLKDPAQFTPAAVRRLIASGDDTQHNQLRVTKEGIAHLVAWSPNKEGPAVDDPAILFRLETSAAGNDYVGVHAAADEVFVTRIYDCLKANWPHPAFSYIDQF